MAGVLVSLYEWIVGEGMLTGVRRSNALKEGEHSSWESGLLVSEPVKGPALRVKLALPIGSGWGSGSV